MYSQQVQRLLRELPNRGPCPNSTHKGRAENPGCGDIIELQLEIRQGQIIDCRFQAYGCPGAVAAAAGLTEMVKGKMLEPSAEITQAALLEFLGGLPKHRQHGVDLAVAALSNAIG